VKGEERSHRRLAVWKMAMDFTAELYSITGNFPPHELYGLVSQMRRASVSIPSNIAEGAARLGNKEFRHFLNIAQGSISELDTQIEIAKMLGYISDNTHMELLQKLTSISKMLYGLARTIK